MNRDAVQLVIFIGPPGSGKGTLSQLCIERLGWKQLSTGALCRMHIAQQTPIGKSIDFAIKSGKLVSDELITDMVKDWLAHAIDTQESPIILDGFPRTTAQAEALKRFIDTYEGSVEVKVVRLSMSQEGIIRRLTARMMCSAQNCQAVYSALEDSEHAPKKQNVCDKCDSPLVRRSDDAQETIKNRLKTYHDHEQKLLSFYKNEHAMSLIELDVDTTTDNVFVKFVRAVGLA